MSKSFNSYSSKSSEMSIKDLDTGSRKVAIYLSTFDSLDSDNDIIRKGAFKKSIQERGPQTNSNRQIAFLRYHNWEKQIGRFEELSEDSKGLFAVGYLGTSTLGSDALADYKDGIIKEHSIGFNYIKDKIKFIEDSSDAGGFYEINEVKLWEGSAVTFGANEHTNVIEVAKSLSPQELIEKATHLSSEIDLVGKALANGQGTDDRLHSLEMKLKVLNSQLLTLVKLDPLDKQSISQPNKKSFDWEKVVSNINL